MVTMPHSELRILVSAECNTAIIRLSGRFTFGAHREFKAVYRQQLADAKIGNIVIDFAEVNYLDSSALGMLLLLRDHVQDGSKSLSLSRPSPIVERTFELAGFRNMFTIN